MNENNIRMAMKVLNKWVAEHEEKLADAIKRENWRNIGEIDAYLAGLSQAQVLFEQATREETSPAPTG